MIKRIKILSIVVCLLLFTTIFIGISTVESKKTIENRSIHAKPRGYWRGARTFVSGYITKDTTWEKKSSPYVVTDDIIIDKGITLTIEPGVIVKFHSYCDLYIDGFLSAVGSKIDRIVFTSIRDDAVSGDTNGDGSTTLPKWGDWKYIKFRSNGDGNIQNSSIKYGFGIYCENSSPIITSNSIIECLTGIFCKYSSPTITDNTITNAPANGIFCSISSPTIEDNIITNNHHGIFCAGSSPEIIGNIISYNKNGVKTERYSRIKSSPTITENIIMYNENGISCSEYSFPFIASNIIVNNLKGISSKGTYLYKSEPIITGNTIANNIHYGVKCGQHSSSIITFNHIENNGNYTEPIPIYNLISETSSRIRAGIICSNFSNPQIHCNNISFNQIGILCYPQSDVNISSNRIDNNGIGIISIQTCPTVKRNDITRNQIGIALCYKSKIKWQGANEDSYLSQHPRPSINWNNIFSNAEYGMVNLVNEESPIIVNATYNWWGSQKGPSHESNLSDGDRVSDYISFNPWLDAPY